jgi:hypothetical protein
VIYQGACPPARPFFRGAGAKFNLPRIAVISSETIPLPQAWHAEVIPPRRFLGRTKSFNMSS